MATLDQLKQALINAEKAGDTAAAQKLAAAIKQQQTATPAQPAAPTSQPEQPGFLARAADVVTGNLRETEQTQTLPDWTEMPEMNDIFSMAGWKTGLGTLMSSPDEAVKVIQANFPGVQIGQDEKGNYLLTSQNGQTYAVKPGFRIGDIPRAAAGLAAFTPAGRATSILGAGAAAAGTQAAIEGTQAATGGTFNTADVVTSGVLGAAMPAVTNLVKNIRQPIAQATGQANTPIMMQPIKEAEDRGIRVLTTDVYPPKTFVGRSAQAMGERVPIAGTGGIRKAQQVERIRAIRSTLDEFGAADAAKASDEVMEDLLKTRGASLTKYSGLKNEVIDRLAARGSVPVNNAVAAIDEEIRKLLKNANVKEIASVIDDLTALRTNLQGKDLRSLEQQRILLGEKYKGPEMVAVRGIAEKALAKIYGPLRQDMGEFIKRTGDRRDFTKWAVANKQLSSMAGDLENSALKSVLKRGDATPEAVQKMLFSKKPSEIRALYSQLSPKGRASARMAILARAAEKSAYETADGAISLSPEKFMSEAKRLGGPIDVFFSGEELRSVKGLVKALEITRRAGESGVMTKTGQELYGPAALGLGALNWQATLAGGLTTGALARAYESKPIRDMLLKMPSLRSGSAEQSAMAKRITAAILSGKQFNQEKE